MNLASLDRSNPRDLVLLNMDNPIDIDYSIGSKVVGWQQIQTTAPYPSPKLPHHPGIRYTYIWNALNRVAYKGSGWMICEWMRGISLEEMLQALIDHEDPAETWLVGGDWHLASRIRARYVPVEAKSYGLQVV